MSNKIFVDFNTAYMDSEGRALSKEQLEFFAGSKCVDESGRLLVVYHASNADFDEFSSSKIGTGGGTIYGRGFYFNDSDFGLDIYGTYIKEYYLNLQKPFIWQMIGNNADAKSNINAFMQMLAANSYPFTPELRKTLEDEIINQDGELDTIIELTCGEREAQAYFKNAGFDGIMNFATGDMVAFEPHQIKRCLDKTPTKRELAAV